jgi:hypothetical protein
MSAWTVLRHKSARSRHMREVTMEPSDRKLLDTDYVAFYDRHERV